MVSATSIAFGEAVIAWPAMVVIKGFEACGARCSAFVSMMRAGESTDIGVSDTVIAGPSGVQIVPANATVLCPIVIAWPAIVVIVGSEIFEARGTVLVPMTRTDGLYAIGVPETVIGGVPGVKVVPAIKMP